MRISGTTSVGIGATVKNVLADETFQLSPMTGAVRFYALTSAGEVRATILVGKDLIADDAQLGIGTKVNLREDLIAEHGVYQGEPLLLRLRQVAGGAAVNVVWIVDLEEV